MRMRCPERPFSPAMPVSHDPRYPWGAEGELEFHLGSLAALGIPAVATDLHGLIREWNQPAAELYGHGRREMLGTGIGAIRLSETDDALAASIVSELLRVGRWHGEIAVERARGTPLRLETRATLVIDDSDHPVGFEAVFRDLSETATSDARFDDGPREAETFWQAPSGSLATRLAILDEDGTIIAVNATWRQFMESGGADSAGIGCSYVTVCEAASEPLATAAVRGLSEILAGTREDLELDYPCHSPSGSRWFLFRATRLAGVGPVTVVVSHSETTDCQQVKEQAFLQATLLDEIDVSVIMTDLDLNVLSWNAGAERLYGWSAQEAIGRRASETILPPESVLPAQEGKSSLGLQPHGRTDGEYIVRRKDGSRFAAHVRSRVISDRHGHVTGAANVSMDITERREAERALVSTRNYLRAVTDGIGEGLFSIDPSGRVSYMNRVALDLLGWDWRALEGRDLHPLLHSRGPGGSPMPTEECQTCQACRRSTLVHVENGTFVRRDGRELPVAYTASPFATDDGVEGCVVLFEDITERQATAHRVERDLEKLAWLKRIQEALTEEHFVLYAQPIIDLRTGAVVQRELLIRLRDAQAPGDAARLIAPVMFLPIAEEFGLVTEIDHWVIDRATELAAAGDAVQINVSGRSISAPGLVDHITYAIQRTGADPRGLVFEITETALVSDEPAARAFVESLHALGCKIALDDFGTGYGGFTYLKQLPVDFLKIDVEFVRDVRTNSASRNVIQAIVGLAGGFGLTTVGEGVEDEASLRLLRELGVDYAQGFHIGRPAPLETAQHPHHGDRK